MPASGNFKLFVFVDSMEDNPLELESKGSESGFSVSVFQCEGGFYSLSFEIEGRVDDGNLVVEVRNANGIPVAKKRTRRE